MNFPHICLWQNFLSYQTTTRRTSVKWSKQRKSFTGKLLSMLKNSVIYFIHQKFIAQKCKIFSLFLFKILLLMSRQFECRIFIHLLIRTRKLQVLELILEENSREMETSGAFLITILFLFTYLFFFRLQNLRKFFLFNFYLLLLM